MAKTDKIQFLATNKLLDKFLEIIKRRNVIITEDIIKNDCYIIEIIKNYNFDSTYNYFYINITPYFLKECYISKHYNNAMNKEYNVIRYEDIYSTIKSICILIEFNERNGYFINAYESEENHPYGKIIYHDRFYACIIDSKIASYIKIINKLFFKNSSSALNSLLKRF